MKVPRQIVSKCYVTTYFVVRPRISIKILKNNRLRKMVLGFFLLLFIQLTMPFNDSEINNNKNRNAIVFLKRKLCDSRYYFNSIVRIRSRQRSFLYFFLFRDDFAFSYSDINAGFCKIKIKSRFSPRFKYVRTRFEYRIFWRIRAAV